MQKTVNDMKIGESAVVTGLGCAGALRRRIIDMGITPGALVILRKAAPMGDPLELKIHGYEPVSYTHPLITIKICWDRRFGQTPL